MINKDKFNGDNTKSNYINQFNIFAEQQFNSAIANLIIQENEQLEDLRQYNLQEKQRKNLSLAIRNYYHRHKENIAKHINEQNSENDFFAQQDLDKQNACIKKGKNVEKLIESISVTGVKESKNIEIFIEDPEIIALEEAFIGIFSYFSEEKHHVFISRASEIIKEPDLSKRLALLADFIAQVNESIEKVELINNFTDSFSMEQVKEVLNKLVKNCEEDSNYSFHP